MYPPARGLSPRRANELFMLELGRSATFQIEAFKEAEEVMRKYAVAVVGSVHSKGVGTVMGAAANECHLKGLTI